MFDWKNDEASTPRAAREEVGASILAQGPSVSSLEKS
jgi:hypothetical protein